MKKHITVAAAIIRNDEKFLCSQRLENKLSYLNKKWEFAGGKIEDGEEPKDTAIREIKEELGVDISIEKSIGVFNHEYEHFYLKMHVFTCKAKSLNFKTNSHIQHKFLTIDEMNILDWAEADIPIINALKNI